MTAGATPTPHLCLLRRAAWLPLPAVLLLLALALSSALAVPRASRSLLQVERYSDTYDGEVVDQDRVYPNDIIDEVMRSDDLDMSDANDAILPQNVGTLKEKKAPSGFLGMRGRRLEEDGQYTEAGASAAQKRKTYGFLGVRGKKAPLGFVGMRGKKAPSGFLGVRGKKDVPQNLEELLKALSHRYETQQNSGYKRGAPLGFIGMRGRRTDPFGAELGQEAELERVGDASVAQKRGPSRYGFIGLRG